jgi:FkbM family methyltransferase
MAAYKRGFILALSVFISLALVLAAVRPNLRAVYMKWSGQAVLCSWRQALQVHFVERAIGKAVIAMKPLLVVKERDLVNGIELIGTPERDFWIRESGSQMPGAHLLSYLIADHKQILRMHSANAVKAGDIVIDCGAHVGVYTHFSLRQGASQVVAIEPDPVNVECLRRNFKNEIAAGRVLVVAKAAWDSNGTMTLYEGVANSGMNSLVTDQGGRRMTVPVQTIDSIVQEMKLRRVDYIKMDIEGAERNALKGSTATLRLWRPRLMLDSYHRPDDPIVLPRIVRSVRPDYRVVCGFCQIADKQLLPHVMWLR